MGCQFRVIVQLQLREDKIEVGKVLEQLHDRWRCLGEIHNHVAFILLPGKLLRNGGFSNTACPAYQQGGGTVLVLLPLQHFIINFPLKNSLCHNDNFVYAAKIQYLSEKQVIVKSFVKILIV